MASTRNEAAPGAEQQVSGGEGTGRRSQILDVATRLFREKGYHATSLGDIADVIGFTKPAIYYYFESKEDILFEIVDRIAESALARIRAIVDGTGSCRGKLHAVLVENTKTILDNLDANAVFYNERGLLSAEREREMRSREREYTKVLQELYAEGVSKGEFLDIDPAVAASTLVGASIWSYRWFDPSGRFSAAQVAEMIADLLASGYAAESDGAHAPSDR